MSSSSLSLSEAPSNMLKLKFDRCEFDIVTSVDPCKTDTNPSFASNEVTWSTQILVEPANMWTVSLSPSALT